MKRMVFYEYPIRDIPIEVDSPSDLQYKELTNNEYGQLEELLKVQNKTETVFQPIFNLADAIERIKSGEHCFICKKDNMIIGYVWYATEKKYILEINATIHLKKTWIYGYNAYVRQEFRGKNIADYLFLKSVKVLEKKGYTRMIVFRMNWNKSVERAMMKVGFSPIGYVKVGYLFTFRYLINRCKRLLLMDESNPFEFHQKFYLKLKNLR